MSSNSSANGRGDVEAAIDAVKRLGVPVELDVEGTDGTIYAIPEGMEIVDLKPHLDARRARPERTKGTARHTTLESFVAHVVRFADAHSAIFAIDDARAPRLVCVFDYHEHVEGELARPRFGEHRAEYAFPLSDEWKAWTALAARPDGLSQADFAAWVEDHLVDVLEPSSVGANVNEQARMLGLTLAGPSTLLAFSRGLSVRVDQKVTQAVNLATGESQIGFEEQHNDKHGGRLSVPGAFAIAIPVFRGGALYSLAARLRYRVREGAVSWRVLLPRTDVVFADAFSEACSKARADTGRVLFTGTPEV